MVSGECLRVLVVQPPVKAPAAKAAGFAGLGPGTDIAHCGAVGGARPATMRGRTGAVALPVGLVAHVVSHSAK
jgi:hypothetical protein